MLPSKEPHSVIPPAIAPPESSALLDRLGYLLTLGFLFITFSRVTDGFAAGLHLPAVIGWAALLASFLTRRIWRGLRLHIGKALVAFTVLMALSVPFSVWRGGSFGTLTMWLKSMAVFFMITSFVLNSEQLRTTVRVIALSGLVLALMSLFLGSSLDGRLILQWAKFGNSNDLAQVLLIALPMWWLIGSSRRTSAAGKLFAFVASTPLLVAFAKTGSRAGLIGFLAMLAYLGVSGGAKRAVAVGMGGILIAGVALLMLPGHLRQRFFVLFGEPGEEETLMAQDQDNLYGKAAGSAEERWTLLKDSLTLTVKHPLLGVGPGQFQTAQNDLAGSQGRRASWRLTHNLYTQVSSENGIPALLLFLWAIVESLRVFRNARRYSADPQRYDVANTALFVTMSLVGFLASALFSAVAYDMHFPLLAGLAGAISLIVKRETARSTEVPVYVRKRSVPAQISMAAAASARPPQR